MAKIIFAFQMMSRRQQCPFRLRNLDNAAKPCSQRSLRVLINLRFIPL
jgi:hypothetical protein